MLPGLAKPLHDRDHPDGPDLPVRCFADILTCSNERRKTDTLETGEVCTPAEPRPHDAEVSICVSE